MPQLLETIEWLTFSTFSVTHIYQFKLNKARQLYINILRKPLDKVIPQVYYRQLRTAKNGPR